MLLHHFLLRPAPLVSLLISSHKPLQIPLQSSSLFISTAARRPCAAFFSSGAILELPKPAAAVDGADGFSGDEAEEIDPEAAAAAVFKANIEESKRNMPTLSVKERKELASYAHGLGKKLKIQQVGKSGVTDTVVMALDETLEANELLKLKIHNNCPGELDEVVVQLEKSTGSAVIGQIGRTVIFYRPSVTKMQMEEKKKQAMALHKKRQATFKPFQSRKPPARQGQPPPKQFSRGRRGSSRFSD